MPSARSVLGAARARAHVLATRVEAERRARRRVPTGGPLGSERLPDHEFVRLAYNFLLDREPDEGGWRLYLDALAAGTVTRAEIIDTMRSGPEAFNSIRPRELLLSLHRSRSQFVRSFPPARRILDLGGTHQSDPNGAMVSMGYPYAFDELVIVDLPHDDRHDLYRASTPITEHRSPNGLVRYEYHSMVDLSRYGDASFDLVYSGQTIEHVSPAEADEVLAEAHRVLRPGGWLYLDTPNGPVCRLHTEGFTNPDHQVEYASAELEAKLEAAGFDVRERKGLNWAGPVLTPEAFSLELVAHNVGVFGAAQECYLLAYGCRR